MNSMTTQRQGDPVQVGWTIGRAPLALRGIRFADGETGAAPAAPVAPATPIAPAAPATPAAPAVEPVAPAAPVVPSPATVAAQQQTAAPVAPPAPAAAAAPQAPATFGQEYVHELREEAKANRIASETATAALAAATSQLATLQRESSVRGAADGIANAALLLDSASFQQSIAQVDPADPAAVKAAIEAFVGKNPAYAATIQLPGSSGGTPTGGTNQTPNTLQGAIASRLQG